jgi:glucose-1-phosphate adenylyltransferase
MCYSETKQRFERSTWILYHEDNTVDRFIQEAIYHNMMHWFFDVIVPNFDRLHIQGYEHKGYVGCITSVEAYYNINMDMLKRDVYKELFLSEKKIYTRTGDGAPAKYGPAAEVKNSLICSGCEVDGKYENLLSSVDHRSRRSNVKNSVVMAEGFIAKGADIDHTVMDRHVKIYSNARLAGSAQHPVFIPKGASVNE